MQVYNPNDPQFHIEDEKIQVDTSGINFEMTNDFESGVHTVVGQRVEPESVYDQEEKSPFQGLGIKYYFYCVLFVAMFFLTVVRMPQKTNEYVENGIPVTATVSNVIEGLRYSRSVYGTYLNDNREIVHAEIINSGSHVTIGSKVEGYYLREEPGKVWCRTGKGTEILLLILGWIFGIAGVIGLASPVIYATIQRKR